MVKVVVPNKAYRGVIAGVQFHNGVGIFEDEKLAKQIAEQFGFEVVEDQAEVKEEKPVETKEDKKPAPKKRTKKAGE
jgi:FAD synthase